MTATPTRKKRSPRKAAGKAGSAAATSNTAAGSKTSAPRTRNFDRAKAASTTEWLVAAAGGVIVAAVVAYMTYLSVATSGGPPDIRISAHVYQAMQDHHLVSFTATNAGNSTAAQVQVLGKLVDAAGETVEEANATLDYLPNGSKRTGALLFQHDPAGLRLEVTATGFEDP